MSWYYSKNGVQLGPVSRDELVQKWRGGEVGPGDLVWKEGMTDWRRYADVPELQGGAGGGEVAPALPTGGAAVAQPGYSAAPYSGPPIPNYLWQSIVVTVLCCLPFGVVAIVYAAKVDSLAAAGDITGAKAAAKSAKMWVGVAVGSWLVLIVLYIAFAMVMAMGAGVSSAM